MPDLLRLEANERIDLGDFQHAVSVQADALARQSVEQVLTNPSGAVRAWVLEGFRMLAVGTQVQVTRGVALLARRDGGQTFNGMVAAEGDVNKIVDVTAFAPGVYGIFIRFEYVDGDTQNRVFWNPSGLGSEFAQSISTRRKANWSVRVELTTPGGEWLQIGTVNRTPMTIVDLRPLYFEGRVDSTYQSGWSTDGGGIANDRNANRQLHGVRDFQTFTAAMRQALEDIKGRGLRRWWDRDIGGMNIGFDAAPVEDRLALGDVNFSMLHTTPGVGSVPTIVFDAGSDRLRYDRTLDQFEFQIAGSGALTLTPTTLKLVDTNFGLERLSALLVRIRVDNDGYSEYDRAAELWSTVVGGSTGTVLSTAGLQIREGLVVGFSGTPATDTVQVFDTNFALVGTTSPEIRFDGGNDRLQFVRGSDLWNFQIAGVTEVQLSTSGIQIANGLIVGFSGTPTNDRLLVGNADFGLHGDGANPDITFDAGNDLLRYERTQNEFEFVVNGTVAARTRSDGLIATRVNGTENFQTPSVPEHLTARHAQNAVVSRARILRTGAVVGTAVFAPTGDHWNVLSVVRNAIGNYTATLDVAVDVNATVLGNMQTSATLAYSQCFMASTTQVTVLLFNPTTGAAVDIPDGTTFSFAVFGRPNVLPTFP